MKVLLLSPLPPPVGGIATWTGLILSAANASSRVEIDLLNTAVRGRSIIAPSRVGRVIVGGVQAVQIFILFLLRCIFNRPSLVHLCTPCDLGMVRDVPIVFLSRILGIPVVLHFHRGKVPDFPDLMKSPSFLRFLIIVAVKIANAVVVLNTPALKAIASKVRGRIVVVPNMVDVRSDCSSPKSSYNVCPVVLFVGHVVKRKGIYDLIEACKILRSRGLTFDLRVIGPIADDVKADIESNVCQTTVDKWVHLVGGLDANGVGREMDSADIFCLPSYAEGFPYVILESMAKGLPIVTTNVGAMPEALADGAGICLDPGDIAALAAALENLIMDFSAGMKLGIKARARCSELYSKEAVFASLESLWGSVV